MGVWDGVWLTLLVGGPAAFQTWRYYYYRRILRECREGKRSARRLLSEGLLL